MALKEQNSGRRGRPATGRGTQRRGEGDGCDGNAQGRDRRYKVDLPAHMAECDANFLRLQKLFPCMKDRDQFTFGVQLNGTTKEVCIEVLERSPYTTLLKVTQLPEAPWGVDPVLKIRLYHDARSAEVIEYQKQKRFDAAYRYPNPQMRQKDEKAQVNRFLSEFLSHCLANGVDVQESVLLTES